MKHAFPRKPLGPGYSNQYDGMTLREYYIGQALAGTAHAQPHEPGPDGMAKRAIAIADAVLKQLESK